MKPHSPVNIGDVFGRWLVIERAGITKASNNITSVSGAGNYATAAVEVYRGTVPVSAGSFISV